MGLLQIRLRLKFSETFTLICIKNFTQNQYFFVGSLYLIYKGYDIILIKLLNGINDENKLSH